MKSSLSRLSLSISKDKFAVLLPSAGGISAKAACLVRPWAGESFKYCDKDTNGFSSEPQTAISVTNVFVFVQENLIGDAPFA